MDLKEIYSKLEKMNEQISKLRESSARTEAYLESLAQVQAQVNAITQTQNQWKGAVIVISGLFSIIASILARFLIK
jgi:lipid II:glycine glycyltransferase (peptidoglycan interpeptide bridge formation enzyme)